MRGSSHLISSGRCCFFSSLSEGITLGSARSRYEILYRLGYTELVSFTTTLNSRYGVWTCFAPYKQTCINVYGRRSVGLTEYLGKGPADIFLCVMYPKVVLIYGEIFKAGNIIICALLRVLYRWIFYACSLLCHH